MSSHGSTPNVRASATRVKSRGFMGVPGLGSPFSNFWYVKVEMPERVPPPWERPPRQKWQEIAFVCVCRTKRAASLGLLVRIREKVDFMVGVSRAGTPVARCGRATMGSEKGPKRRGRATSRHPLATYSPGSSRGPLTLRAISASMASQSTPSASSVRRRLLRSGSMSFDTVALTRVQSTVL